MTNIRELHCDDCHYVLYEDADGFLYIQAFCNQSAFYFTVAARLLPSESEGLFKDWTRELSAEGKARLGKLADTIQWSPEKFDRARREMWRRLGHPDTPAVPPLKPSTPP